MQLRPLGSSGLLVSVVGLGTNNFGMRKDVVPGPVVHEALDLGINFFDTAAGYGYGRSEQALGEALGSRRKEVIIATKWGMAGSPSPDAKEFRGGSRDYLMKAVEQSLRDLQTDYIDLYQFHFPDLRTPIEETLRTLEDLIRQGKVRYTGVSNMPAWRVVEAQLTAQQLRCNPFVSCQDGYSLLNRTVVEPELQQVMLKYGLGLLPFFPLASGLLTGKYRRDAAFPEGSRFATIRRLSDRFTTERNWDLTDQLQKFADDRGHTLVELAFSWLAAQPAVASIIAGATQPGQVRQNAAAVQWALSADDLAEIDRITGKPAGAPRT
jgi:aryl-alcohol dehydrogenase-like predicted oxidoreductase